MKAWRLILAPIFNALVLTLPSYPQEKFYRIKGGGGWGYPSSDQRESVRPIGVNIPEAHKPKNLLQDANRMEKDNKSTIAMGMKSSAFTKSVAGKEEIILKF